MAKFELDRLAEYTNEAIIDEIRRVAALVEGCKLTKREFDRVSKVHSSTVEHRFGGWSAGLAAAGLLEKCLKKTQTRHGRESTYGIPDEELILRIKGVAAKLGKQTVTIREFREFETLGTMGIGVRFGGWNKALAKAGLRQSKTSLRYADQICLENLLEVWTHYGRAPTLDEMRAPPSVVGAKAYILRWNTWRKALRAFVEWANQDHDPSAAPVGDERSQPTDACARRDTPSNHGEEADLREIRPLMKVRVWIRDKHCCCFCGRSPANTPGVVLHVDHIVPVARGGKTIIENLRTLCSKCNLGKGSAILETGPGTQPSS